MIQVYMIGNENFQANGDAVLMCYSCDLSAELNGSWTLSLEIPIDEEGRWKLVTEEAVLKVPTWQDDEQLYRISKITKTEDGISAVAYPIFFDSANDCFLIDVRPVGKNGQQALDIMTADSPYSGESDITAARTAYFVRRNLLNAINGNESPTFIERWGGEILYDNYKVIINSRVGGDYGVEARYGRNIQGTSYVVDTSNIVTRIVPVAYNGHMIDSDEPWVDSPNIGAYAKVYTKEVHYENIRLAEDAGNEEDIIVCEDQADLDAALQAAAEDDFARGIDTPNVSIDIDMAIIQHMASEYRDNLLDENDAQITDDQNSDIISVWYRNYATLEKVRLGDTIRCRHYKLDVTTTARVIAITWDCVRGQVSHITIGDYQSNYVKSVSSAVNRVAKSIREDGSLIAEKVQGFLNGAQTQLRTQYNLAERQDVMAILFENLDKGSPMYGALGIGTQGICISKTRTEDGRDWDWTTGITANGINASAGVFGILADKLGQNYINLDTGEISLSSETLIGNKTIDGYMSEADQALADYIESNDAVIRQIQGEIDGQYGTYFQSYTPTLNNYPANEWTTPQLKEMHEGDLFYNKNDGNSYRFLYNDTTQTWEWKLITDQVAAQALALASQAQDTADGKRRVFTAQPVPPYDAGDVYFTGSEIRVCVNTKVSGSYAEPDFARRDTYNTNAAFQQFLNSYNTTISGIQSDVDDRIETWPQSSDPSTGWSAEEKALHAGDIWYNTSTGIMKYWTGSAWTDMTTNPPASVVTSINAKAVIFTTQPTPPYKVGDLWFNSSTSDIMTCMTARSSGNYNSGDWEKRNRYTDDSALNAYKAEMASLTDDLQNQLDGKIQTFYQTSDPSANWTEKREDILLDSIGNTVLDEESREISTDYEYEKLLHTGDLWQRLTDNTEWRWSGSAWEPVEIPDIVKDTLDGKKAIFSVQPVPPYEVSDLWVQGETGDILVCQTKRSAGESFNVSDWKLASKYTDDSSLTVFINGEFETVKNQLDRKIETWYQTSDPSPAWTGKETDVILLDHTGVDLLDSAGSQISTDWNIEKSEHIGDIWQRTTDNTQWRYGGDAWEPVSVPDDLLDTIDGKAQVFVGSGTPVNPQERDLWFKGTEEGIFTYIDGKWVIYNKYTDDENLYAFVDNTYTPKIAEIQEQLDGKIETYFYDYIPSASNMPAVEWATNEERALHVGDLFYDTSLGHEASYRYECKNNVYQWSKINDANITKALQDVSNAQTTADKKMIVFTAQPVPPYQKGDMWVTGSGTSGTIKYCTTARASGGYVAGDWTETPTEAKAQATIQALNGQIIAQVVAGNIVNAINLISEGITINANKLNINGVTSINSYFKVKTDGSFETIKGKIGNIFIIEDAIYSGSHTQYNSDNTGFYLGSNGSFGVGNGSVYLRYLNTGQLDIRATSVTIGGQAVTTADVAQSIRGIAEASGGTATNFLYYDETNGLIVSEVGTVSGNSNKPYNTQIKGDGIYFRTGTKNLSKIDGSSFTLYVPGGKANVKMMQLTGDGLYFYKSTRTTEPGAEVVAAKYTYNGFEVLSGKVAGFTIDSGSMYVGTLGDSANDSVYVSAGTSGKAIIAGSNEINGWILTAKNTFGVNKNGNMYANAGLIGGIHVADGKIYSGSKSTFASADLGFYLGSDGQINIGGSDYYIKWATRSLSIKASSVTMGSTSITDAAKTASSFLHQTSEGLTINNNQSSIDTGFSTRLTSTAIQFRSGSKTLADITGSAYTIYRTVSNEQRAAMVINNDSLTFYKPDGNPAASIWSSGFLLGNGTIGGFDFDGGSINSIRNEGNANTDFAVYLMNGKNNNKDVLVVRNGVSGAYTYPFVLHSDGSIVATKATITGAITATSLTLGTNASISSGKVTGLTGIAKNNTIGTVAAGHNGITISEEGLLRASNAIIYGTIYATNGSFSGSITGGTISIGSNFDVTNTGVVTAKSMVVRGIEFSAAQTEIFGQNARITTVGNAFFKNVNAYSLDVGGSVLPVLSVDIINEGKNGRVILQQIKSAAGLKTNANGVVQNTSSSIRFKTVDHTLTGSEIEPYYSINAVMAKYKDNCIDKDDEWYRKNLPMIIAEDVNEVCYEACCHDEDGQVTDWNYRVLIPVHQQMLVEQHKKILELEARITELIQKGA